MRYRILGKSGLRVSEISLGTMTFGEDWGWGASREDSRKQFDTFAAAGGNFIDTADIYTNGTSEQYVGDFVRSDREHFVVATKYANAHPGMAPHHANSAGNHRKKMVESLNASLKRMNLDYIDLYWVHIWDGITPVEETMRALDDMIRAGKILYIGVSDWPAWTIARANAIAELRGWSEFIAMQIEYSLIERTPEQELIPLARATDIGVTTWSPLGAGALTGKYTRGNRDKEGRIAQQEYSRLTERVIRIAKVVDEVADELGVSSAQVALAWQLQTGEFIPIIGATKVSQVKDNLKATELTIPSELMDKLNEASRFELGFPQKFITNDFVANLRHAGLVDQIEPHRPDAGFTFAQR